MDEARERRREKMMHVAELHDLQEFLDDDDQLNLLCGRISHRMSGAVQMKMLGQTVRTKSIFAGRSNYLWMTITQNDERMVAFIWPRPMFSEGVRFYATSKAFIDRVRMTFAITSEEDFDFS